MIDEIIKNALKFFISGNSLEALLTPRILLLLNGFTKKTFQFFSYYCLIKIAAHLY